MADSPCSSCRDPGYCCRNMSLFRDEAHTEHLTLWADDGGRLPWTDKPWSSMKPVETLGQAISPEGRAYEWYRWSCGELTPEGKCGIYADRPEMCRAYQPLSSPLCIMHSSHSSPDD